jgi:hypothetical protein
LTLQLFLNDLSIPDQECTLDMATGRLKGLLSTFRAVGRVRSRFVVNADRPFAEIAFGLGRPLAALRNEAACADERIYLKTIVDRSPWIPALAERPPDAVGGAEYRIPADAPVAGGADAVALGLAHDLVGLGISLPTHDLWDQPSIGIVRTTLDHEAEPLSETVQARNASRGQHVEVHAADLARAGMPEVRDGTDLWERRAEIVPNLRFIPSARQSIEALPHGDPNFENAVARLIEIDDAIGEWARNEIPYPAFPFSVVGESRNRLRDGLVDFKDADGFTRRFSDHARYGPDENRIHFIIETEPERHALVGHVGRKLGIG